MPNFHILFVSPNSELTNFKEPGIVLVAGERSPEDLANTNVFTYSSAHLQTVLRELEHLLTDANGKVSHIKRVTIPADPVLLKTMTILSCTDSVALLYIVLAYCLTIDKEKCSALLRPLVAPDADLFDMLYRYRLEPWSVARYAQTLGLSRRKFNQLFQEKFGMSAKHWLHEQRLKHAKNLLETTTKKVIDVALESGFCNAAHFSDSFRRHFSMSPSDVRRGVPLFARYESANYIEGSEYGSR